MLLIKINDFKNKDFLKENILLKKAINYIYNLLKELFENGITSKIKIDEFVIFVEDANKQYMEDKILEFYTGLEKFADIDISCSIGCLLTDKGRYIDLYDCCKSLLSKYEEKTNVDIFSYKGYQGLKEPLEKQDVLEELQDEKIEAKNYENMQELLLGEDDLIACVIDASNYKVVDGSDAYFKILNKTKEECLNNECYKVFHNREKPCIFCKSSFYNEKEFFSWIQYNRTLNKTFLLKNKLVSYQNKKCILALFINIPDIDEEIFDFKNKDICKSLLPTISYLSKQHKYEENIIFILEIMNYFYKSEFGFVFEIKKDGSVITHTLLKQTLGVYLKSELEDIVINEFIPSNIDKVTYLKNEKEAIPISYDLYTFMLKYNLSNVIIVPIINKGDVIGYTICINNSRVENSTNYEKLEEYCFNVAYFLGQEIIKNNLKMELDLQKNYDNLTGLLNRSAYIKYEKKYDADSIESIGAICLALNELNNINHTVGILAGDQTLNNLADILKAQFNKNLIFRINGNEFLVIIKDIGYDLFIQKIEDLNKELQKRGLSMTYGNAWSSEEKELNYIVNSAIYHRKTKNKKNEYLVSNNFHKRNTLLSELMLAIDSKEYEIFLQPKFCLTNNSLCGAEALIRKRNSEGGYIPPDKFIPILEQQYLIHYIDLFVFEEVLKLLQSLKEKNQKLVPISLNFSRRTLLEDDIIKMVLDIKNRYDIDYEYVEVEVTESIGDLEKKAICGALKEIGNVGIKLLLDDFGVKYSNLTILSEIKFDGLKIDKSMVKHIGKNVTNELIMKNIICMCKDLNIKTIAEGIETEEQENILKNMKCDVGQGYLYSKPLPVSEFLEKFYN